MDLATIFGAENHPLIFSWIVLPLLIFTARIIDVSLGTIRFIFIARGIRNLSAIIGFFEVLIWIIAISQIMLNIQNVACYIAYAGGFSAGTFIGQVIEQKISLGQQLLRIITKKPAIELIKVLRAAHYGVTSVEAEGASGKVHLLFLVVRRNSIQELITKILHYNPDAFYTIEDLRTVRGGTFPQPEVNYTHSWRRLFPPMRKGK